jgi:SIR2-like domain
MLSENDRQNLFRNLARNRVVLVTGAGFSADATNQTGSNLPVGSQLAEALWNFLYDGEYDNKTTLKTLYGAAQTHRKGKAALREFFLTQLQVKEYPSWYSGVATWFWRRVYTFNADDLLERIYRNTGPQELQTIVAPAMYEDRDAFLRKTQYIKLHGSITDGRDLTFGPREYGIRAAARTDIWYLHFVEDYSTMPTLFVGTDLDEPLFWQYVELRGAQTARGTKVRRPKCFLVSPNISRPNEEVLEQYNIVCIRSTAREFFAWINENVEPTSRENVLRLVDPTLEPALLASERGVPQKQVAGIEYFYSFFRVPVRPVNPRARATFLLGNPPTWEDIAADLDAHRQIDDDVMHALLEAIKRDSSDVIIVSSAAGGGKSTICKRAAMELIDSGYSVYFSDGERSPDPEKLTTHLVSLESRVFVFFDNAGHDLSLIADLAARVRDNRAKPVIVVAARSNDLAFKGYEFNRVGARVQTISIPNLCDEDVNAVLEKLERHDVLGNLREKTHTERMEVFRTKARKQILVAMREATSGRGFDEIIQNEFASLQPKEAQLLYLVAALASDGEYGLSTQQMITAMDLAPNDTQVLIEKSLAGILIQHEFDSSTYFIRHPAIAHFVIDSAPRPILADAVVALLITISTVLPSGKERRWSRAFRLYRSVLNHHRLNSIFSGKQFLVRKIYEGIKDYYRDDGHYWLQYGSYETEYGGDISLAENYIQQATALLPPYNRQIETATAHLLLKKTLGAPNAASALPYVDEALKILRAHMADQKNVSLHALHIFGSQMLKYIWQWIPTVERAERFRAVHDELRRAIPAHLRTHPDLNTLIEDLKRAELETTVRKANTTLTP